MRHAYRSILFYTVMNANSLFEGLNVCGNNSVGFMDLDPAEFLGCTPAFPSVLSFLLTTTVSPALPFCLCV